MYSVQVIIFIPILFNLVQCFVTWDGAKELHPVHGLYVKPSTDGTTGDLYVSATEDNGIKTQWFTDQPINFLPSESKIKSKTVPASFTTSLSKTTSPNEQTITSKKRAVITNPGFKYAYAMQVPGAEVMTPFSYPITTRGKLSEDLAPAVPCTNSFPTHPYSPYNYFYPYMMSAFTNAMKAMKENETSEEGSTVTPLSQQYWPPAYSYPYPYVMVDPSAWTLPQSNASPPSTSTASSSETA